jgi:hypothetical protein
MPTAGFADSNRASIRFIAEDTADWGVTPASGNVRELRFTSSSLVASKETVVSDELRADRMVSSVIEVSAMTEGDINFEFSAGSHDDFLQAFVLGAWSRPMSFDFWKGNTVSITGVSAIAISGGDYTDYFTAGRYIKTEGFIGATNNGYNTIASVAFGAGVTTVTITETDLVAEAGTAYTKIMDANDVTVLNSSALRLGTAGAATIDSNSGNAFASAIAAGQLVAGQKIYVDTPVSDVTFRNNTVTWTGTGADADSLSITDGTEIVALVAGVDYTTGGTATDTALSFANAVNAERVAGRLNVKAVPAVGVVTLFFLSNSALADVTEVVDGNTEIAVGTAAAASAAGARGVFTIVNAADDVLTVTPTPPTVAAPGVTSVKASMLRNPGDLADITAQSFSLETSFNDVDKHFLMTGMRVGTFSMDVSTGAIVTGTMAFNGKETTPASAEVIGDAGSYTLFTTTATEVMNATTNVGDITKNGSILASAVQSITLEGDATLRNQMAVGSKFPRGIGTGRFNLTGTMTAYFETLELYSHFINHDTISLGFDFTDLDFNHYVFTVPAVKITSDPVSPTGIDEDITEEMEWTAFRDASTACMLQVDRFSSIKPE